MTAPASFEKASFFVRQARGVFGEARFELLELLEMLELLELLEWSAQGPSDADNTREI